MTATFETDRRSTGPVIEVEGLNHVYGANAANRVTALNGIDLTVREGEFVALIGPSGCGKTTLLNLIAGLESHAGAGSIAVMSSTPRTGQKGVGYMLARDCLLPWRKALDNAALALQLHGVGKRERTERARDALATVGLAGFENAYPAQLSQGMRQRVALARVFAENPQLILLDEPFSALDAQTRIVAQEAFVSLWEKNRATVILVTHDLNEAVALADRVVLMTSRPGRIKEVVDVDLPRPRSALSWASDPHFQQIYENLWKSLKDEVDRTLVRGAKSLERELSE